MQLGKSGTIKIDGCQARFTAEGQWVVSKHGKILGHVDSLAEIPNMIRQRRQAIFDHLAEIERRHQQQNG